MATKHLTKARKGSPAPILPTPGKSSTAGVTAPPQPGGGSIQMSIQELRFTVLRLRQARCVVTTAVGALVHQSADADADIASVLQHSLGAILLSEITRFEGLLNGGALE